MAFYVHIDPVFFLSENNRFGGFLINSLKHKRQIKPSELKYQLTGDTLMVGITEHFERNYGIYISEKHQYRFNNFLYDDFNDRMVDFVLPKLTGTKGDIRRELLAFRKKYSISEDDLPFTTMKKQFERTKAYVTACKSM